MSGGERRALILVGGGGHCKSVIEAAYSAGWEIKGILDMPQRLGMEVLGVPVVGSDNDISRFAADADFIVSLGSIENPLRREQLHKSIKECGGRLATIVAATAMVSPFSCIGEGTVVLHRAVVNAAVEVGSGCIINTGAVIEHDVRVGAYCHISTGAVINGACRVGEGCFVGSRVVIANGVEIVSNCVVGAGSVVMNDLTLPGIYYGAPARFVRKSSF